MNKFKRVLMTLGAVLVAMLCVGCADYVPLTTFEIETKDGRVINLACPAVDPRRSTATYLIESYCVVYE